MSSRPARKTNAASSMAHYHHMARFVGLALLAAAHGVVPAASSVPRGEGQVLSTFSVSPSSTPAASDAEFAAAEKDLERREKAVEAAERGEQHVRRLAKEARQARLEANKASRIAEKEETAALDAFDARAAAYIRSAPRQSL